MFARLSKNSKRLEICDNGNFFEVSIHQFSCSAYVVFQVFFRKVKPVVSLVILRDLIVLNFMSDSVVAWPSLP